MAQAELPAVPQRLNKRVGGFFCLVVVGVFFLPLSTALGDREAQLGTAWAFYLALIAFGEIIVCVINI